MQGVVELLACRPDLGARDLGERRRALVKVSVVCAVTSS
jgi:hypothetical protein